MGFLLWLIGSLGLITFIAHFFNLELYVHINLRLLILPMSIKIQTALLLLAQIDHRLTRVEN